MNHLRKAGWAALLGVAFALADSGAAEAVTITVDENGHGTIDTFSMPFSFQNDPGPGGLPNVLTYSMLNPPNLTAGDVLITDTGALNDVVRFNPNEICSGGTGC